MSHQLVNIGKDAKKSMEDSNKEFDSKCCICNSQFEVSEQLMSLPCFHTFHDECCAGWFKEKEHCPICNVHVISKEYGFKSQSALQADSGGGAFDPFSSAEDREFGGGGFGDFGAGGGDEWGGGGDEWGGGGGGGDEWGGGGGDFGGGGGDDWGGGGGDEWGGGGDDDDY